MEPRFSYPCLQSAMSSKKRFLVAVKSFDCMAAAARSGRLETPKAGKLSRVLQNYC